MLTGVCTLVMHTPSRTLPSVCIWRASIQLEFILKKQMKVNLKLMLNLYNKRLPTNCLFFNFNNEYKYILIVNVQNT